MAQRDRNVDPQTQEELERSEKKLQESLDRLDNLNRPEAGRAADQPTQATGTGGGGSPEPTERGPGENVHEGGLTPAGSDNRTAGSTGSTGVSSGLQPGGTRPAGGRRGGFGSIGTGGGQTGPGGGTAGATRPPEEK